MQPLVLALGSEHEEDAFHCLVSVPLRVFACLLRCGDRGLHVSSLPCSLFTVRDDLHRPVEGLLTETSGEIASLLLYCADSTPQPVPFIVLQAHLYVRMCAPRLCKDGPSAHLIYAVLPPAKERVDFSHPWPPENA